MRGNDGPLAVDWYLRDSLNKHLPAPQPNILGKVQAALLLSIATSQNVMADTAT